MQNTHTSGWNALHQWNSQFKSAHLPSWFTKRIQALLLAKGHYRPDAFQAIHRSHGLFDHWGSVPHEGSYERSIYTMPYTSNPELLNDLADRINCGVTVTSPGPWADGTILFVLTPRGEPGTQCCL